MRYPSVFIASAFLALPALGELNTVTDALVAGDGYSVYRIPGFTVAADGSLLLFAEGRPSQSDPGGSGDIDLVFTRSTDGGQTWSDVQVLHESAGFDYSDPRVVIDQNTGNVHLLYVQWPTNNGQTGVPTGLGSNSSVTFYQSSNNHGLTWSGPQNINAQVKEPTWASLNTGPGLGIQLRWQDDDPSRNGRLIVPAHYRPNAYRGVILYSDDGGASWDHGTGSTPGFTDESEIIELVNGDLLWDGRQSGGSDRERYLSTDGGQTWGHFVDSNLTITAVDTGIVRYSAMREGEDRDRILYSGPLGSPAGAGNSRNNIGVWTSYDEGRTFINPVQIQSGSAAYSVIDRLQDGTVGLIYEVDHNTIRYVNFDLAHLEGTGHAPTMTHYDGFGNDVDRSLGGVGWSGGWASSSTSFTNSFNAALGGSSIPFAGLRLEQESGRMDLNRSGNTFAERTLSAPINMAVAGQHYIAFLASQQRDTSADGTSQEFLDVRLVDGTGATHVAWGVGSAENLFLNELGDLVDAGEDGINRDESYLFVAKLVTQGSGAGAFDQLFVHVFTSGDAIPDTDTGLGWTLVGSTNEDSDALIEAIRFESGSAVDWSLDELRIGTTFSGVASGFSLNPADVTGDGEVGQADLDLILANWGQRSVGLERIAGDLDGDRAVGIEDLDLILANWNATAAPEIGQVPEPASAALLLGMMGVVAHRPWRRH